MHTGQHHYCDAHTVKFVPEDSVKIIIRNYGWECPACGVVYAPHIRQCDNHSPKSYTANGIEGLIY